MLKLTNEKKIILFFLLLVITSFSFLTIKERINQNPNLRTGWWAVYFENPKNTSDLAFTIENNGQQKEFRWNITSRENNTLLESGTIIVSAGQKETILPNSSTGTQDYDKIVIEVSSEENKKEIYK